VAGLVTDCNSHGSFRQRLGLTRLGGYSQSGGIMVASSGSAPDAESVRAMIVILAAVVAIFWKHVIRVVLALIVVAIGVGAYLLLQGIHG
jgi:hypothetical protein